MSYKCSARFCSSKYYRNKQENITFFTFPTEKKEFYEWANLCQRSDLEEEFVQVTKRNQKLRLCEKHFSSSDIHRLKSKKYLKIGALPCEAIIEKQSDLGDCNSKLELRPNLSDENGSESDPLQFTFADISNSNIIKSNLEVTVNLSNSNINTLVSISNWSKMLRPTILYLDNNNLKDLDNVMQFERLTLLSLANNEIGTLTWCMYLKNLEILNLSNNKLFCFYGIISLPKLKQLNLSGNLIESVPIFPPSFGVESKLEKLDLSCNKIKGFLNFSQFEGLKELLLHKNMITWPHSWKNVLPCFLTRLTLAYNAFSDLLELKGLRYYKHLTELTIVGNPCVGSLLVLDADGKQMGNIRQTNFRPYLLTCCPNLNFLDDKFVQEKDRENSLWLLRQIMFLPESVTPTHGELVMYLAETSPLTPEDLDQNGSNFDDDDDVDGGDDEMTEIHVEPVENDRVNEDVGEELCSHHVELMEQKAQCYKYQREIESLTEERTAYLERIQHLQSILLLHQTNPNQYESTKI